MKINDFTFCRPVNTSILVEKTFKHSWEKCWKCENPKRWILVRWTKCSLAQATCTSWRRKRWRPAGTNTIVITKKKEDFSSWFSTIKPTGKWCPLTRQKALGSRLVHAGSQIPLKSDSVSTSLQLTGIFLGSLVGSLKLHEWPFFLTANLLPARNCLHEKF